MNAKTTAGELAEILRRSVTPSGKPSPGYFCTELTSPDGTRRADALFVPLGHAQRGEIHGYEIKISRADLITELRDPMKSDPWQKFCTRWWLLVSHPSLAEGLDIPEHWGIMAPPAGRRTVSMTIVRQAPLLKPTDISLGLVTILSRMHYGGDNGEARVKSLSEMYERQKTRAESLHEQLAGALAELREQRPMEHGDDAKLIGEIVNAARELSREKYGHPWSSYGVAARDVAQMILDAQKLSKILDDRKRDAKDAIREMERDRQLLDKTIERARQALGAVA